MDSYGPEIPLIDRELLATTLSQTKKNLAQVVEYLQSRYIETNGNTSIINQEARDYSLQSYQTVTTQIAQLCDSFAEIHQLQNSMMDQMTAELGLVDLVNLNSSI